MKISDLKDQLDKKSIEDRERLQKQLELNQLQRSIFTSKPTPKRGKFNFSCCWQSFGD